MEKRSAWRRYALPRAGCRTSHCCRTWVRTVCRSTCSRGSRFWGFLRIGSTRGDRRGCGSLCSSPSRSQSCQR
ncbi:hypothetical protein BJX65DRAFT_288420 [Aspergillus insuetus]